MKVDNRTRFTINKVDYGEEWSADQKYSLRLVFAYGGYGVKNTGINDSSLPEEMLVDYVHFYPVNNILCQN